MVNFDNYSYKQRVSMVTCCTSAMSAGLVEAICYKEHKG